MATERAITGSILVIEDDRDIREVVAQILEHVGYQVLIAADGEQALATLREGYRPGVILLNLVMPVMNGWTFRAEQLQDAELAEIPVVLLSGHGDLPEIAQQLRVAGALSKPVFVPDLLRTIAAFFP